MTYTTTYKTIINAVYVYEGESLEDATRAWDAESFKRTDLHGGIMVLSFTEDGTMIRDGWILHVDEEGHIFLNPSIGKA